MLKISTDTIIVRHSENRSHSVVCITFKNNRGVN